MCVTPLRGGGAELSTGALRNPRGGIIATTGTARRRGDAAREGTLSVPSETNMENFAVVLERRFQTF